MMTQGAIEKWDSRMPSPPAIRIQSSFARDALDEVVDRAAADRTPVECVECDQMFDG